MQRIIEANRAKLIKKRIKIRQAMTIENSLGHRLIDTKVLIAFPVQGIKLEENSDHVLKTRK